MGESVLTLLVLLAIGFLSRIIWTGIIIPNRVEAYFKTEEFLNLKGGIADHIQECVDLNDHIRGLKSSYADIETMDYGEGKLYDASTYNMQRKHWSGLSTNTATHHCSLEVVKRASEQPFVYLCKFFKIKPNEDTLAKLEYALNNFLAAEQGKMLLINEQDTIISEAIKYVPEFVMKYDEYEVKKRLGFIVVDLRNLYFPVYTFHYVSAGGNSTSKFDFVMDLEQLERFIAYVADSVRFTKSAAGQRALMTARLRESIKVRDNFTCQICDLSTSDEKNLLLEIDHIIPISKGGTTTECNLQTLCWKCNRTKGSKILSGVDNTSTQTVEHKPAVKLPVPSIKITETTSKPAEPYTPTPSNEGHNRPLPAFLTNSAITTADGVISKTGKLDMTRPTKALIEVEKPKLSESKLDMTRPDKTNKMSQQGLGAETAKVLTKKQKNATTSAKGWLEYSGYSRKNLIKLLRDNDGYEKEDAVYAVDVLHLDWKEQAVRSAKIWLEYSGYSRKGLVKTLRNNDGYTKEDATEAVDALQLDWKEQATRSITGWLEYSGYSYKNLIQTLRNTDGYTKEDATYAVDALQLDWKEQAVRSAVNYLEYSAYSHKNLTQILHDNDGYTKEEAAYAAQRCIG